MKKECGIEKFIRSAYLFTCNNKVVEVGIQFTELTGYIKEEVLNKDIRYVGNNLLKMNTDIDALEKYNNTFFIFTKELRFKEIEVMVDTIDTKKIFRFIEKLDSSFEERQSYIEQFIQNNFTAVAVYSAWESKLLKANQKYLDFLEEPYNQAENSLGLRLEQIIPNDKAEALRAHCIKAFQTSKVVEIKEYMNISYKKNITYWNIIITPVSENNKLKYFISNNVEITEEVIYRKKIEKQAEELRQQKEQLESVFKNISDALFIINPDGTYRYYNKRAEDMAYNIKDIKKNGDSMPVVAYYDINERKLTKDELPSSSVLNGEKIENVILKVVKPNQVNYYNFNGCPIYNDKGDLDCAIICVRDMTRYINSEKVLKLNQEKLLEAEKAEKEFATKSLKIKEEFLASITHEFKTPLTIINAAIQAVDALYSDELTDNVKKHLRRIQINVLRQIRFVNNLLDITRFNAGYFKFEKRNIDIVYLSRTIVHSVDLYAKQKEVELKFSANVPFNEMAMDEEKYERILLNLLSNAIKFTPKGKSIKVYISHNDNKAIVRVKDEGIGIPKDKMKVIFERFGQVDSSLSREAEGTGIGLSLVATLVAGLEGTISVKSEEGKGSTFTVKFPITKLTQNEKIAEKIAPNDSRIMQATKIEFSGMYLR